MNLPNKLTLLRILLVPVLVACLMPGESKAMAEIVPTLGVVIAHHLAWLVFVLAAITDYYDGKLARERDIITNFGRLMDPLADKLLVAAAFVAFVGLNVFPAWFVIVILFREFIVTGLRTLGTTRGRIIHADAWGKHKTAWQMVTIFLTLLFLALRDTLQFTGHWYRDLSGHDLEWWFHYVILGILMAICLVLTVLSGTLYVVRNWDLVRDK
jgi:CDP-diacylglycerol--glycerol-3-phosphate 3-phosphatidyltransferase